jgi:hypothetical protein
MGKQFEFSCIIQVDDPDVLVSAARERAAEDSADLNEFIEDYGLLYACLMTMFDPGTSPPGCSIIDSHVEELC